MQASLGAPIKAPAPPCVGGITHEYMCVIGAPPAAWQGPQSIKIRQSTGSVDCALWPDQLDHRTASLQTRFRLIPGLENTQTPGAVHRRAWPPAHRDRAHRGPQLPHQGPDRGLSITPASFPVGRHQSAIPVKPRQQFETGQIAACSGRRPQLHRLLAAFLPTDGHRCPVAGDRLSAPAAGADVRAHLAVLAVAPHPGRHVSRTAQAVGACHRLACRRRAQLDLSVGAVRSVKILAGWRIGAAAAGGENSPLDPLEEAICGELIASAQRPAELSVR